MTDHNIVSFYWRLLPKILCIYFSIWAIRRKGEVDYSLNRFEKTLRWSIVILGFMFGYVSPSRYLRLFFGFLGLSFFCWPNLAYHLGGLVKKSHDSSTDLS